MLCVQGVFMWIVRWLNNSLNHINDPDMHFKSKAIYTTYLNKLDDPSCILLLTSYYQVDASSSLASLRCPHSTVHSQNCVPYL